MILLHRMRIAGLLWPVLALCLMHAAAPARADADATPADRQAIRAVIEQQIAAFQRDDAEAAFSYASPKIQRMFGSSDKFMRMVRQGYQPVYRPRQVQFGLLARIEGQVTQRVLLIGPDGLPATALYVMQRLPDGTWRIDGCMLLPAEDRST